MLRRAMSLSVLRHECHYCARSVFLVFLTWIGFSFFTESYFLLYQWVSPRCTILAACLFLPCLYLWQVGHLCMSHETLNFASQSKTYCVMKKVILFPTLESLVDFVNENDSYFSWTYAPCPNGYLLFEDQVACFRFSNHNLA